jgi:hypothetical protein
VIFNDSFGLTSAIDSVIGKMFNTLRPDVTYKPLIIDTRDNFLRAKTQLDIQVEFQNKISKLLKDDEKVSYLIINTHGNSRVYTEAWSYTSLEYLGDFFEHFVDDEFQNNFSSIRDRATDDLRIIMNSCSTFCAGGKLQSERRARQILTFFNAPNGGIYGANVNEVGMTFDHPEYLTLRSLLPSLKSFLMINLALSVLIFDTSTVINIGEIIYSNFEKTISLQQLIEGSFFVGTITNIFLQAIMPLLEKLKSILSVNRGYYFAYENGSIRSAVEVIKKDEFINWIKGYHSWDLSCQQVLGRQSQ